MCLLFHLIYLQEKATLSEVDNETLSENSTSSYETASDVEITNQDSQDEEVF